VSCKDKSTLSNIERDKQLKIYSEVFEYLKKHLNNSVMSLFAGGQGGNVDTAVQKEVDELMADLEENFVSDYEIAA
jgi:hypothetical protein